MADPAPMVNLVLPAQDMSFSVGQPMPLWADVAHFGPDATTEFLIDGQVVATDNAGARSTSAINRITVLVRPWSRTFTDGVRSPQAAGSDDTIYVVSAAGALHTLNSAGQTNWVFATDEGNSSAAPAVAADGTVLFGDMGRRFHALAPDGTRRWELALEGKVAQPALLTACRHSSSNG